ncbi:MAG: hypothetical protein R2911_15945 [Caldilineaceae bacterium]
MQRKAAIAFDIKMASFIKGIQDDFIVGVDNDIRMNVLAGRTSKKHDGMATGSTIEGDGAAATVLHSKESRVEGAFGTTGRGAGAHNGIGGLHWSDACKKPRDQATDYQPTQFNNVCGPLVW